MKIDNSQEHYPTIKSFDCESMKCTVEHGGPFCFFDKLDGTNLRFEWSKKRGFHNVSVRNNIFIFPRELLSKAIELVREHEPELQSILSDEGIEQVQCYFEFFGKQSLAGCHTLKDEHKVVLIDVAVQNYNQVYEFMAPPVFTELFLGRTIETPNMLYYGFINETIVKNIKDGTLPGMTFEGVVCKGRKRYNKTFPEMIKIKNRVWVEQVKTRFNQEIWEKLL